MSPHLCFANIILSLSLLLIGLELCQSVSLQRLRIQRDTRNIPSNLFQPLGNPSINSEQTSKTDSFTFSERSNAEAHTVTANSSLRYSDEEEYNDDTSPNSFSSSPGVRRLTYFPNAVRAPLNTRTRTRSFEDPSDTPSFRRTNNFRQPSQYVPNSVAVPLFIQGSHQQSEFSAPITTFMGPSRSSSNNYYQSESYSYSSDGNGPPQMQRNVFDSRLGHGMYTRF